LGVGGGAEGLKHFGEIVFGFGRGVAESDRALKVISSFGHAMKACEDCAEGFVKARIIGAVAECDLKH